MKKLICVCPIIITALLLAYPTSAASDAKQEKSEKSKRIGPDLPMPNEKRFYKEINGTKLEIWIYRPSDWKPSDRRSAIVFYHGGGWRSGSPSAFSRQSAKLAERGMVAFSVQYRLTPSGATIADCVKDAKSAFRWVIAHASELGIDPGMVSAGGGSAGGHLACSLGTLELINESSDDLTVPTKPATLVLFNPAAKLRSIRSRDTPGSDLVDPFVHLTKGHPPTIIFHGEDDTTVPIVTVRDYAAKVRALGGECEVIGYPGQVHSFFNKEPYVWDTLKLSEEFLEKKGQLKRN